jgi:nucleoside-diphosphate-sugar epimerase
VTVGTHLDDASLLEASESLADEHADLVARLDGMDAVVNAAGDPDASSLDSRRLLAANALVPGLLCSVSRRADVPRFVHVSSAVVQNDADVLDDAPAGPGFSPYSRSKCQGERVVGALAPNTSVIYRPPSVHAVDRRVTRMTARVARSPLASVAGDGTNPTPQALLANVADAISYLATTDRRPPPVVTHPWEGLTTGELLLLLGRRSPRRIPEAVANGLVRNGKTIGRWSPTVAANARRVEMLWLGQRQSVSWLTAAGWLPPVGREGWEQLGALADDRVGQRHEGSS